MAETRVTWFITGVSSGLGGLIAESLLERGDRVVGTSRHLDALDDLASRYDATFTPIALDVTDPASSRFAVDAAFRRSGRIDVVVNNAGFGVFASVEETTDEQLAAVIDTTCWGRSG